MKIIAAILVCFTLCFGAFAATPNPVGTWQADQETRSIQFLRNGTVIMSSPGSELQNVPGKWEATEDGRLVLQFQSMWGATAIYAHFEGDVLILEDQPPLRMHRRRK
jgi:hypothetical protein